MTHRILATGRTLLLLALSVAAGVIDAWAQAPKAPQTITFTPLPATAETLSALEFNATASSGLQPLITVGGGNGVCTALWLPPFSGPRVLLLIRPGVCTLTANQAGDAQYEPAPPVTVSLDVTKRELHATLAGVPASATYGSSFEVTPSTENASFVPGVYGGGSCTVSARTVTMTSSAGYCLLVAWHPGSESATVVPQIYPVPAARRPITLSAVAQSKFQGTADPALRWVVASGSLVPGDVPTGTPARVSGEVPGTYEIYQYSLSLFPHYDMTWVTAPFTVVALDFTGPAAPAPPGTPVAATTRFLDVGAGGTPQCAIDWDDPALDVPVTGTVAKAAGDWTCTFTRSYSAPGVYDVVAAVTDPDTGSALRWDEAVIYDPRGAISAEGWFLPTGAYVGRPAFAGVMAFSFSSSYGPGRSTPAGEVRLWTEATWFFGVAQEWLVAKDARARLRGWGVALGGDVYGFEIMAKDGRRGSADTMRVVLWNHLGVVYDSEPGLPWATVPATPLAGGTLIVGP